MSVQVDSKIELGYEVVVPNMKELPVEQMVRSMDWETFLSLRDGDNDPRITRNCIVTGINDHWWNHKEFWSIDSRVHMLMKGWYPCIPGWHHDDVQRTREDKQPNYYDDLRCEHAILLINADVAPTKFAIGKADFSDIPHGQTVYEKWHREVEQKIVSGELEVIDCPNNQWVYFDDRTWHTGVQCDVEFGHRLFIRIGMHYRMVDGVKVYEQPPSRANEIRRNAQVYMDNPMKGW